MLIISPHKKNVLILHINVYTCVVPPKNILYYNVLSVMKIHKYTREESIITN